MNKRNLLLGVLAILLAYLPANGQYVLKQAAQQATLYNYVAAIPLYEKAYKKVPSVQAARGLATSYYLLKDYVFAESWYAKLVAMPAHTAQDELQYAEVLINCSKYAEAKEVLNQYLAKQPTQLSAVNMKNGCDSALIWMQHPGKGDLVNMQALNSKWSDWGTAIFKSNIIFASDRPYDSLRRNPVFSTSNIRRSKYGWTGNSYLHLYEGNGTDSASNRLLSRHINGDYHSATATFTADHQQMYYAETNLVKKKSSFLGKEVPFTLNVEIKGQQWDTAAKEWKPAIPFPYNAIFNYSVGDPYITPDGQTLYFVADYGDKGLGGTDIYYCRMGADGNWQEPVNMGPAINTAGNERTPFLDATGTLYFASDGRAGMGGLDLYKAEKGSTWKVVNLGSPINSPQDDFAPFFADSSNLYFSSNRLSGKGSDDIYRFTAARMLFFSIHGKVFDKKTQQPLANAVVTLENLRTGTPFKAITDEMGNYHFQLDSVTDYRLGVVKTDYATINGVTATTNGLVSSTVLRQDFPLEKSELNKPYKLENIYFDLDKSNIRPDAAAELDKLVQLLTDNPTWKVEMSSHTDSRANDQYNMKLSQRRATSTVAYLVEKGIAAERLTAKGYGENRLVNRCANGVACTEKEHQENRRTEFTILDK